MKSFSFFRFARVRKASFWECEFGSIILIPVKIPDGAQPKVEGQALEVGRTTLITRGVEITPQVEFLWMR